MPTRRTILQSVAALSAAPLAPKVVFAEQVKPADHLGVLYDHRHQEARAFRLRAAQWNAPIMPTRDGDITELWQNYLSVAWREKPQALSGMTERPALFLLEQLGWQHGLRVLFQAEHEPLGNGAWTHTIVRSSKLALKGQLDAAGTAWPSVLADQIVAAPHEVAATDLTPTGAAMAAHLHEPEKLYSWIIAPKSAIAQL